MIASILPAILPTVGKLVDKIFPDEEANKREKLKIEQELLKQLQSVDLAQIAIIKIVSIHIAHVILVNALKKNLAGIPNVIVVGKLLFHQSQEVHRLKWADPSVKLRVSYALACRSQEPSRFLRLCKAA